MAVIKDPDADFVRQSVASIAYDAISDRITSGEFGSNDRLTEAELIRELQVSRGAVREAMSKLAADGLIEIELNKGAVVRPITRNDMSDFLQVRSLYESFAAKRAAERINETGVRALAHAVMEECDALIADPTPEGMIRNDTSFHSAIMEMSGNAIMGAEWRRLRRSRYRINFLRSLGREEILVSVTQHRENLLAILDGDAELASNFAAKHVSMTNARIQRLSNQKFDAIFNSPGRKTGGKAKQAKGVADPRRKAAGGD